MENYFEKNLIDEISYCLSKNEMTKINFDFRENFVDKIKAVNAELVILIADKIDTVTLYHFIRRRSNNSSLSLNFMSKFLIVTSNSENANSLTSIMEILHIFNFAIVYEDFDGETAVFTANFFFNKTKIHKRIKREKIMATIFPDKLKNLNGYNFRVFISQLFAHTEKSTGEIFSKYLYFIQEISKIKNAEINLTVWSTKDSNLIIQEIEKILINKNFDLLIFDILKIDSYDSRLDVYEQNGLCFIVPSTRTIFENFEIFLGFIGGNQKFFVVISSVLIIFIWSLYRKRGANNSVTKTALYLWASAYDKTLKLRNNRLVLTVMLQLFVIAMLFYNLIFNAVFTSIMTVSIAEMKYKSVTELIDNNEKFTMDGFVSYYLKDGNEYKKLEAEDRIKIERHVTYFANDFDDRIIISQCNFVQMYEKMNNWSPDSYYVLPEKILSHYTQLEVGILNPFRNLFQKYIDMSFESGLLQIWEKFYELKSFGVSRKYFEKIDENLLTWKEVRIAFYQLRTGLILATFVFFCEILHFYIFQHWFAKIYKIFKRKFLIKKERKVLKVKRIKLGKKKAKTQIKLNRRHVKVCPANNQ